MLTYFPHFYDFSQILVYFSSSMMAQYSVVHSRSTIRLTFLGLLSSSPRPQRLFWMWLKAELNLFHRNRFFSTTFYSEKDSWGLMRLAAAEVSPEEVLCVWELRGDLDGKWWKYHPEKEGKIGITCLWGILCNFSQIGNVESS